MKVAVGIYTGSKSMMTNPFADLAAELEFRRRQCAMDAETKHDPSNGQFTGSGGSGSSGGNEQKHGTHPLPNTPGGSSAYDLGDGRLMKVSKKADGSYYADTGNYDFEAPNAEAMRAKIKKNEPGAKHAGWEK